MASPRENIVDLGTVPILGAKRFRIWSEHVQANFIIDVSMPSTLFPTSSPSPVLVVTDGNLCFSAASSLSNALSMEPNGPPPLCVVGIGYDISGGGELAEHHVIRVRDLTPCEDKRFEAMMRRAPEPFTWREDIVPGGADQFLKFILEELMPWLAKKFNIDLENKALAGISLGGLFVLNTLFSHPEAFNRYIAISPATWWADKYLLNQEQIFADKCKNVNIGLYMAVGECEEAQDPQAKMVSNFTQLVEQMLDHDYPSLEITYDILLAETHMSVFSPAFSRGLRALFARQKRDESWANLDA